VIDIEGFRLGSEVPSCPRRFTVLKYLYWSIINVPVHYENKQLDSAGSFCDLRKFISHSQTSLTVLDPGFRPAPLGEFTTLTDLL